MRKTRKDNTKKERIIMIASSVFVLTALTMTGVYMQSRDQESENDGYTIDFSVLENNVDDKLQEIQENNQRDDSLLGGVIDNSIGMEDNLPMEVDSNLIEIPGLTDGQDESDAAKGSNSTEKPTEPAEGETVAQAEELDQESEGSVEPYSNEDLAANGQDALGENVVVTQELHFSENEKLLKPLAGEFEVLIPFSMNAGVYFKTLDHYKRSKAMVISAPEGTTVTACAAGKVVKIFQDAEYGHAVTMDLGDGYEITYGQLRDIRVAVGSYVNAGDSFATVAKTTKYYVREGNNLYLQLTANGTVIDPSILF